jgi:pilus assembly protein CpaB
MHVQRVGTRVLRGALRHRRVLAAALAAGAVVAGVQAVAPPAPATRTVLAAAHDLAWGARIGPDDLRALALPLDAVPDGALTDAAAARGRLLAGPVRRGEALTDLRLVGPGLLEGDGDGEADGLVATPVRIADPDAAGLLRAGDVVDVLAAGGEDAAEVVASAVRVLVVPQPGEDGAGVSVLSEGALVVLATTPRVAAALARAATNSRLSVTLRVIRDE